MNITDLIESYFSGEQAERLGQAVGMDGALAQKALAAGIPMQLSALADHAAQPGGPEQLMEAMSSLPNFGSIASVLGANDGASNLQRAGELLSPVLLGGKAEEIVNGVTSQVGGSVGGIQKILQMALPLLLSLLGTQGLNAGNLGSTLEGLRGKVAGQGAGGLGAAGLGAVGLGAAAVGGMASDLGDKGLDATRNAMGTAGDAVMGSVDAARTGLGTVGADVADLGNKGLDATRDALGTAGDKLSGLGAAGLAAAGAGAGGPEGLLELLKAQFSGAAASKLGTAAGFNANAAGRAVQGALPVVLNAVVNKGSTEAGAADLTRLSAPFGALSDAQGLNAGLLNDSAELARVEGQGRGVLGSLFGNVDEITGRLGTALGGSGASASRLLALMTPFVLSLLGKHTSGMNAPALSTMLGGLGGSLSGLLPAGMGGLAALLGAGGLASASAVSAAAPTVTPARPDETVVAKAVPAPTAATPPAPTPAATTVATPVTPASTVTTTERRGGFPWWLIPLLLLLLLGGCWIVNRNGSNTAATTTPTTSTSGAAGTTTPAGTFAVTEPAANATLPAGGFTMRGTGKPGDQIQIFDGDTSLGTVTVAADGTWSQEVPSPTAGAHTYNVKAADGTALGSLAATIGAASAGASAANCTSDYTLSMKDGQTISEPFNFGGKGKGTGYTVTVKRGERTVGTKAIALDGTCGWSYLSRPGKGQITYEVRPTGDASAAPLSTINLTIR